MFNHSCAPNAVVSFVGGRLRVRAIQAVAEGDEVCIAYTELYATADARRVSQPTHPLEPDILSTSAPQTPNILSISTPHEASLLLTPPST